MGGNCPLSEADKTVVKHGVTIVGETNLAALVAADASALYARNVLDFLKLVLTKEGGFQVPMDDDIVALVAKGTDEAARGVVQLKDLALGTKLAAEVSHEEWKAQPAQTEVPREDLAAGVRAILNRANLGA